MYNKAALFQAKIINNDCILTKFKQYGYIVLHTMTLTTEDKIKLVQYSNRVNKLIIFKVC